MNQSGKLTLTAAMSALTVIAASGANAAAIVMGDPLAHRCYEVAQLNENPQGGLATCSEALANDGLSRHDEASTYVNRGIMRARLSEDRAALDDYNRAIALDPNLAEAYVDRSSTLIALHRYRDALDSVNKGISLGPSEAHLAYYNRAVAEEGLGNVRGAYDDLKAAVGLDPTFTPASDELKRFRLIKPDGA